jgi:hypothetical protein
MQAIIAKAARNLWARKTKTSTRATASFTMVKVIPQKKVVRRSAVTALNFFMFCPDCEGVKNGLIFLNILLPL